MVADTTPHHAALGKYPKAASALPIKPGEVANTIHEKPCKNKATPAEFSNELSSIPESPNRKARVPEKINRMIRISWIKLIINPITIPDHKYLPSAILSLPPRRK